MHIQRRGKDIFESLGTHFFFARWYIYTLCLVKLVYVYEENDLIIMLSCTTEFCIVYKTKMHVGRILFIIIHNYALQNYKNKVIVLFTFL